MSIARKPISDLIPHAGSMCLLAEVLSWDNEQIVCLAHSHTSLDNPLRDGGQLPAVCGVEYAAQAMAVHGALILERAVGAGFLAGVRELKLYVDRLDEIGSEVVVEARRLMGGNEGLVYDFRLRHDDEVLIAGRATIALRRE